MANLGTYVVDSKIDKRDQDISKFPIWEEKLTFFTDNGGHAEVAVTIPAMNVILQKITMLVGASTDTSTSATLTIDDANGVEVFNSGAKAESATVPYKFSMNEPLVGDIVFSVDLDKDPGASGATTTVYLRGL